MATNVKCGNCGRPTKGRRKDYGICSTECGRILLDKAIARRIRAGVYKTRKAKPQ